jgi:ketosteroid isomerase-like protein
MKKAFLALAILFWINSYAQSSDETTIRQLMQRQTEDWNRGNIEGFMQPYWKSDSLMFVGKSGIVWGWQQTLNNYKRGYPDTATMGKLTFGIIQVKPLSADNYFVVGKWTLNRSMGDVSGYYTLLWRRINGQWKIVADHSS